MSFRIDTADRLPLPGSIDTAVVDEERKALLQLVSAQGSVPGSALLLTVGALRIPFDTYWDKAGPEDARFRPPIVVTMGVFGQSRTVASWIDLPPVHFESPGQERSLRLLAVEALLVFGLFFDGLTFPDGDLLVEHEGELWRRGDFGY